MKKKGTSRKTLPEIDTSIRSEIPREEWIDNAKALGITLVYYGHIVESFFFNTNMTSAFVQYKLIYSFHMPLFFILSGYSAKNQSGQPFLSFLRSKIISRIIPVIFFNFLILPCYIIKAKTISGGVEISELLFRSIFLIAGRPPYNYITWFLICLFVVEIFHYTLSSYLNNYKSRLIVFSVTIYLVGWLISQKRAVLHQHLFIRDYWYIYEALPAYSFYLMGRLYSMYKGFRLNSHIRLAIMLTSLLLLLCSFNLNKGPFIVSPVVMFAFGGYGQIVLFPLTALMGSAVIIMLSKLVGSNNFMKFIGANTLILMGLNGIWTQFINVYFINKLSYIIQNNIYSVTLSCLLLTFLSMLLSMPVVYSFNRFIPQLVGKGKNIKSKEV